MDMLQRNGPAIPHRWLTRRVNSVETRFLSIRLDATARMTGVLPRIRTAYCLGNRLNPQQNGGYFSFGFIKSKHRRALCTFGQMATLHRLSRQMVALRMEQRRAHRNANASLHRLR